MTRAGPVQMLELDARDPSPPRHPITSTSPRVVIRTVVGAAAPPSCTGWDRARRPSAVSEIGVAFAGPIGPAGDVLAAPTIWGNQLASPYPLSEDVARRWPNARVRILNDVTAAGYRYLRSPRKNSASSPSSSGIGTRCSPAACAVGRTDRAGSWAIYESTFRERAGIECGGRDIWVRFPRGERSSPAREKRRSEALTSGGPGRPPFPKRPLGP